MKKIRIFDGTWLKIIAVICMIFDHVGDALFPQQLWLRAIGRVAFPIFAFCLSVGYIHSNNKKAYLLRIGIFAFISEIPFNLFVSGKIIYLDYQNVMFTFFISILSLMIYDKITKNKKTMSYFFGIIVVLLMGILALVFESDYGLYGVLLVFLYYVFYEKGQNIRVLLTTLFQLSFKNVGVYIWGFLSCIPLFLYNGKRGKGLKWFFYAFYPGHLLIIYLIKMLIRS